VQNETIVIGDCLLAMKQNITKQLLHAHGSVQDNILSVLMLSTCSAKGSVMTAKQTPKMRP